MIQKLKRLFSEFLPPVKPDIDQGVLFRIASEAGVNLETESCLIGIRGFFNKGNNQRGIYDDAIFLVRPSGVLSFNANTDPGAFKKGIANLCLGVWLYKIGIHGLSKPKKDQYQALVQASAVKLTRDDWASTDYGWFGINIHRGGYNKVSSIGCQTIHPKQWDDFISSVKTTMIIRKQNTIKYILKEMKDEMD